MINLLLVLLARSLLWLRYRVRVHGLREVCCKGRRGVLFLPNHPALIDPVILMSRLYLPLKLRPLADRRQVDRFFIRRVVRRVRALPIPDLAKVSASAAEEIQTAMNECVQALREGENLLLYPAGRAYRQYREDLGGSSAVETILRELPDVRVVLVRTRGLWGSSFSWAPGREPDVGRALLRGARSLLLSGLIFGPRRKVGIELVEPDNLPRGADRGTINRYLEDFYNADAEGNTYVPYTIWQRGGMRRLAEPARPGAEGVARTVPEGTRRIVRDFLRQLTGQESFSDGSTLAHDLGMDSLSGMELVGFLQSEFGVAQVSIEALRTVGDVMQAAGGEAVSSAAAKVQAPPRKWFKRVGRPGLPQGLQEMTVAEAFLHQAGRLAGKVVVADQARGVRTYRQLVAAVLLLREKITQLPGDRVGIMMPASVAADVTYLATLFSGKTAVMVNWTLGRRNMLHCLRAAGVERVLTVEALVSQLRSQGVELDAVKDRLIYLDRIAADLSLSAKLRAYLRARFSWRVLRKARVSGTAVILFTSGSEALPKAVGLTHRNILTNVSDMYQCLTVSRNDSIVGILPPFHSFALTTSVLLPLCLGLRVVHHPDPTDGTTVAAVIDAYKASIVIGTPTFLSGIVRYCPSRWLASLRLAVTGAEKCPRRTYELLGRHCPQTVVMEGYGVTECSPVISVNSEDDPRPGTIGKVLRSLDYAVADLDLTRRVGVDQEGVLLVRGPSVFSGYLCSGDEMPKSPFVSFEGKQWYYTGDLVTEACDGILTFAGPLKRFVKLGGEMISLPAIEAVLEEHYGGEDEGPVLAVVDAGEDDRGEIVLFAIKDIDRASANEKIRAAGLSGLHNIRRVIRIDELPRLGTGKTDYRALTMRLKNQPAGDDGLP